MIYRYYFSALLQNMVSSGRSKKMRKGWNWLEHISSWSVTGQQGGWSRNEHTENEVYGCLVTEMQNKITIYSLLTNPLKMKWSSSIWEQQ